MGFCIEAKHNDIPGIVNLRDLIINIENSEWLNHEEYSTTREILENAIYKE